MGSIREACRIKAEEEIDGCADTLFSILHTSQILRTKRVLICENGNRVGRLRSVPVQRGVSIPFPVLESRPKRVQAAVIVLRITVVVECIVVIKKMAVRVEQSFDFQNLFQLGE